MIKHTRHYLAGPGLGPLLIKAVAGSAGLRIAGMGFGFLVGVQLARGLGVENFGVYGIAMAVASILGVPTEFGLPQLLTREIAAAHVLHDPARRSATRHWAFRVVMASSLIVTCAMLLWLLFSGQALHAGLGPALLAAAVLIPLVALERLNGATLLGMQQLVRGQLSDTLVRPAAFSVLLAIFSLTAFEWTPGKAMALGVGSVVIALFVSIRMLAKSLPDKHSHATAGLDRRRLWQAALPMALTEGMRTIHGQMAVLLLGLLTAASVVGLYRVAASIAAFIAMPISLFNIVGGPVIARLHTTGQRAQLQTLLGWLSLGMFLGAVLMSLPFFIFGESLLGAIFGNAFSGAANMLQVLCLGVIGSGLFGASAILLNMSGHQASVTRASLVSLIVLAVLLPISVWNSGGVGAAWAVSIALTLWNGLLWRDSRRLLGLSTTFFSLWTRNV